MIIEIKRISTLPTAKDGHQRLARLLASELIDHTVGRFAQSISEHGGIPTNFLVSGTRDACFTLSELGAFSSETRGYYTPIFPYGELISWMEDRIYAQHEQDLLLRGTCHLWSWFLSKDFNYKANLESMNFELLEALKNVGFVVEVEWQHHWSVKALPWLIEASLADLNEISPAPFKDGAMILGAMPEVDIQRYKKLAMNDSRRVLCLLCANWDGSLWESRGHNFIQPNSNWRLNQAKCALELLLPNGPIS